MCLHFHKSGAAVHQALSQQGRGSVSERDRGTEREDEGAHCCPQWRPPCVILTTSHQTPMVRHCGYDMNTEVERASHESVPSFLPACLPGQTGPREAWEGLSLRRPICCLVCSPAWLRQRAWTQRCSVTRSLPPLFITISVNS